MFWIFENSNSVHFYYVRAMLTIRWEPWITLIWSVIWSVGPFEGKVKKSQTYNKLYITKIVNIALIELPFVVWADLPLGVWFKSVEHCNYSLAIILYLLSTKTTLVQLFLSRLCSWYVVQGVGNKNRSNPLSKIVVINLQPNLSCYHEPDSNMNVWGVTPSCRA